MSLHAVSHQQANVPKDHVTRILRGTDELPLSEVAWIGDPDDLLEPENQRGEARSESQLAAAGARYSGKYG